MDLVPEKISFPKTEEEVLDLWNRLDAFQTSVKRSEGLPEYNFYDGPPFATGLPHYGHILAGTIKDIVTRYAHQTGHHVTRRFGWDCHGLPVEYEIDKELDIKNKDDVLKMGIPKYNASCRAIVMRYSSEWERTVKRLGRWIDFKNDYKTLDKNFMESVWWVFKQIHEKGLVYKGFKVMPYSTACTTPLSNFEANQAYKEVQDPTVIVAFPKADDPSVAFLAWTTTPWTLPSNLALCVNPDLDYVKVRDKSTKAVYILCQKRTVELYKTPDEYEILETFKGKTLAGQRYIPPFNYFEKEAANGAFRVCVDTYVTDDSGTGVVHCAPAFGEDDYRVCLANNIIQKGEGLICPVDASGCFTAEVVDFAKQHVKAADPNIIKMLRQKKLLVHSGTVHHQYPFCWRSDTPLIYKAVPSWFIAVEKVKDQLLTNNSQTYWVPQYVKEKRFHNWLTDARDWAISRNRYWGTPIPIWMSEDGKEMQVIGSIQELEQLSGVRVTDLHRESVDHITIPGKNGGVLKRVEEVFDCWFESGSMPYAQQHYPFENKERFEKSFPADFIAEGVDQTRGWFYTLLVISTILFEKPPFKNLIVNGLVLAGDGKKMSKRLKNYPDPVDVVNQYGADALRLYLINSPVVRAEALKFKEQGVRDILKDVFLPWFNAYRFFVEVVHKYTKKEGGHRTFNPDTAVALASTNYMDKWILAATSSLTKFVRDEMKGYRLYTVIPRLVEFIEQLTNWYVRLNRARLKGSEGDKDNLNCLNVLFFVLLAITKAMAPFTPFLTEYFYQNLRKIIPDGSPDKQDSVHYLMFPEVQQSALNERIQEAVGAMQAVVQLGRAARDRKTLPLKNPLKQITVVHKNPTFLQDVKDLQTYIVSELNVKNVIVTSDESAVITKAKPNVVVLGPKLGKDMGKVSKAVRELTHDQISELQKNGSLPVAGHTISLDEVIITREFNGDIAKNEPAWDDKVMIVLNLEVDQDMVQEGLAREIINRVQKLRKKAGIHPSDPIEVFYESDPKDKNLAPVLTNYRDYISKALGVGFSPKKPKEAVIILSEEAELGNRSKITVFITTLAFAFNDQALAAKGDPTFVQDLKTFILSREYFALLKKFSQNGNKQKITLNDKAVELELGKDLFRSASELPK